MEVVRIAKSASVQGLNQRRSLDTGRPTDSLTPSKISSYILLGSQMVAQFIGLPIPSEIIGEAFFFFFTKY